MARGADFDLPDHPGLARLSKSISDCRKCPRLCRYLAESRARWTDHRSKPVPGWGDPKARLVLVGLAPGVHGANKTGRMFTFDSSGSWLYGALHEVGLSSRPVSKHPGDGLRLRGVWITSAARCAPPQNKPTAGELANCRPFLGREIRLLTSVRVYLALGRIGHEALLRCLDLRPGDFPFAHGAEHPLPDGRTLLDSYHPSRQNTNTGRLTKPMWRRVFRRAARLLKKATV
jgi:uracil-DNA glycosylase family 4